MGTVERDTQREMRAGQDVTVPASNPAIIGRPASTEEAQAAEPLEQEGVSNQVVVGNIPARGSGFLPRPRLLALLNRDDSGVSVLSGGEGVGKTDLAAAYARAKLAAGWRLVVWINARDRGSLQAGLAAVADAAGVADSGSRQRTADAGLAVRQWLEADGDRRLLVFDDAEDPDLLRPFVPAAGAVRVLITGARQSLADLGTSVPVDVLSVGEALALLDGRTGLADAAGVGAVAAELGYLPLALDQAAAVIAGQNMGYRAYLGRLQLAHVDENPMHQQEEPYPQGAAEAVLLALETVRSADEVGLGTALLEVMSVLSPAGVRLESLRAAAQAGALVSGGHPAAEAMVDQALAGLAERSLVTFSLDSGAVIMHRLVARVVRAGLARRQRLAAVCREAASVLVTEAEALAGANDRAAVRDIVRQMTALLDKAPVAAGEADEELARVLLRLRFLALYYLIELGDNPPQAIALGESLTADLERTRGPDHPDTVNVRNKLAAAYRDAGRAAYAIPLVQQTLTARERLLGTDHPSTLAARNNLASVYQAAGRSAEAIPLFEENVAACERLLGSDHPKTLASRHKLALAAQEAMTAENADQGPYEPD